MLTYSQGSKIQNIASVQNIEIYKMNIVEIL